MNKTNDAYKFPVYIKIFCLISIGYGLILLSAGIYFLISFINLTDHLNEMSLELTIPMSIIGIIFSYVGYKTLKGLLKSSLILSIFLFLAATFNFLYVTVKSGEFYVSNHSMVISLVLLIAAGLSYIGRNDYKKFVENINL